MASFEVVIATAVTFPMAALMFYFGCRACRNLYQIIAVLVDCPYL